MYQIFISSTFEDCKRGKWIKLLRLYWKWGIFLLIAHSVSFSEPDEFSAGREHASYPMIQSSA